MSSIRHYLFIFFITTIFLACNNHADKKASFSDSTIQATDSDAGKTADTSNVAYEDCYEKFFQGLPRLNDSDKVQLTLKDDKHISFKDFMASDQPNKYTRYGLKSIDGDTISELVTYNYTGGAHCCDEIYIFGKEKQGYTYKAKLYGGFVCIDPVTNVFTYSFNETLGYFFSCYACGFSDSTTNFKTVREIELRYKNGKFEIQHYNDSTGKQILTNLQILKDHGFEKIEEGLMDNGWRKEFAMNFAVWHYNNGKNWNETKKLFDKYYVFQDAARIWKEFYSNLKDGEKESSL